eukprot:12460-Heterococcus_DN1.PRE.1
MEKKFGFAQRVCKFRRNDDKMLLCCSPAAVQGVDTSDPFIVATRDSFRLDRQIQRGGVINFDFDTDAGLNLLLRGHVQQGLLVACTDNKSDTTMFCGCLQPGWATAYFNKSGAEATFALMTQEVVAAELAKLGIPELVLTKLGKKAKLLHLAALCRALLKLMLHAFRHPCMHIPTTTGALVVNTAEVDSKANNSDLKASSTANGQMLQIFALVCSRRISIHTVMNHAELKLTNICTNTSTRSSQQVVESNNSTVATAAAEGTVGESMVKGEVASKATAASYTAADTANTTEAAMKSVPRLKFALQIDSVAGTETAVSDTATLLTVNKDVLGVKGTGDVAKAVQDVSADKDTSSVADSQGNAKQSSGVVAATAVGTSIGKRKGMTISLAPLVPPVDIYSGASATDSTGSSAQKQRHRQAYRATIMTAPLTMLTAY